MRLRQLGRTGLLVSEIGVGAWQLGGPLLLDGKPDGHPDLGREYVVRLIRRCGDLGINFIDTAEQYGNGESERRVGEALKGRRHHWLISTKFGALVGSNGERINDPSAARAPLSLEGSLRRLRSDYVDAYLYHVPPDPKEAEGVARFLERARQRGLVRAAGISTNDLETCKLLLQLNCLDVVQFSMNLLSPQPDLCAFFLEQRVGGVVRGAFAGGRLSGKYFHAPPRFSPDDIRRNRFPEDKAAAEFARFRVFEALAAPGRSVAQLALRFLLDHPTTHTIILGAKSPEEYESAVAATVLPPLSPAELEAISALRDKLSS